MTCGVEAAWRAVLAAAQESERLWQARKPAAFACDGEGPLRPVPPGDPAAALSWDPEAGWSPALARDDPGYAVLDLYLPLCNATRSRPMTVGHLGQSLDGFIATHGGDSQFVTGPENILHMHRLRALCDAVIVGAGTVAADDPQLTTRHVHGPNPLRVVFDPARRLEAHYRVFNDAASETIYVCGRDAAAGDAHFGHAAIVTVDDDGEGAAVTELQRLLFARGFSRLLVEGGGVTVSRFLKANLLDRLQVAVAPFIMGEGRPAIRLPAPAMLRDCERPRHRVFPMGTDVLFELVIREP
jgi:riboflavin-specific deaminase-like protein